MRKEYKNILICSVVNLGDVIFSTALAGLLKKYYPDARVTLLVRTAIAPVLQNHPYIDEILTLTYKSKGNYLSTFKLAREIRKRRFDLSFTVFGKSRVDLAVWMARVPARVGIARHGSKSADRFSTDVIELTHEEKYFIYPKFQNMAKYFLNGKLDDDYVPPVLAVPPDKNMKKALTLIDNSDKSKINLALCVKAEHPTKNWGIEEFAETVDRISSKYPINAYIVGAPGDRKYADDIIAITSTPVKNLCGQTNMLDMAAVLKQSDLLISLDNGTAHVGSALAVPVVGIYVSTIPAPSYAPTTIAVDDKRLDEYVRLPNEKKLKITVDDVYSAAEKLLNMTGKA